VHGADRVVLCCGAWHSGVLGEILADAPLRRVRLQMLETERYAPELTTSLADGDSLRYYPAYRELGLGRLGAQTEVATHWAAQLLLVQRRHGGLTIGDTHARTEPFPFDTDEAPYAHLLAAASALLEAPLPPSSADGPGSTARSPRMRPISTGDSSCPPASSWSPGPAAGE